MTGRANDLARGSARGAIASPLVLAAWMAVWGCSGAVATYDGGSGDDAAGSSGSGGSGGSGSSGAACTCPNGCCDSTGACQPGISDSACGQRGNSACSDCTASSGTCVVGTCLTVGSSSSGSSGGGTCMPSACKACILGRASCTPAGRCQCCVGGTCVPD